MRHPRHFSRPAAALLAASLALPVAAGPGHDHGDAPQPSSASASPRFEAVSDAFELVGILDGKRLTLYLDRADDNSPVANAKLEVEFGSVKLQLTEKGDGVFEAELNEPPASGVTPVTAVVAAGGEPDLLAGELDIHEDESGHEASSFWSIRSIVSAAGLGAGAVALLAALGWAARRALAAPRAGEAR
ncbi:MAG: hypothetical protein U1E86_09065 [Burkholderiaceae bacterium]|jgi:hypothetical protein